MAIGPELGGYSAAGGHGCPLGALDLAAPVGPLITGDNLLVDHHRCGAHFWPSRDSNFDLISIDPVRLFKCLFVCIHACPGLNFVRLPKSREPAHPSYPLTNCRLLPILVEASRFLFGRRGPFCISHCCWLGRQTAVPTHIRPPSISRASPLLRRLITTGQSTFSQQPASTRHALSPVPAETRPHLHLQPSNLA